jgi:TM2 domain-containing membrane protein YozV
LKLKDWLWLLWGLAFPIAGIFYFETIGLVIGLIIFVIYAWLIYFNTKSKEDLEEKGEKITKRIESFSEKMERMTKAIETDAKKRKLYKNPNISTMSSFFFMGLGQIYNGQISKGIIFMIVYFISIALMSVVIGFVTTPILWVWGMVDANKTAKRINKKAEMAMNDNFRNHSKNIEI